MSAAPVAQTPRQAYLAALRALTLSQYPWLSDATRLWAEGKSVSVIASTFGVRKSVLSGLAHRNRDLFPRRKACVVRRVPPSARAARPHP